MPNKNDKYHSKPNFHRIKSILEKYISQASTRAGIEGFNERIIYDAVELSSSSFIIFELILSFLDVLFQTQNELDREVLRILLSENFLT